MPVPGPKPHTTPWLIRPNSFLYTPETNANRKADFAHHKLQLPRAKPGSDSERRHSDNVAWFRITCMPLDAFVARITHIL